MSKQKHELLAHSGIYLGAIDALLPLWLQNHRYTDVFVLADSNTRPLLPSAIRQAANAITTIPAGESHKTLESVTYVWRQMLEAGLDRHALVINFGGGVVGDLGGFCAATYKRGIQFVQVPTTLLAMTDAAIGGKTGIDFDGFKNNVGVFQQPEAVFVDPTLLRTLPIRELNSGMAEVYKHALIGDPELWQQLQSPLPSIESPGFREILEHSIAVKVNIVQQDEKETSLRALLNYGHTIGHGLESVFLNTSEPLTHGEAVAIGLVAETAVRAPAQASAIGNALRAVFPHRQIPVNWYAAIWEKMGHDKKNLSGVVRMAIPGAAPFSLRMLELTRPQLEQALDFYNALG